MLRAFILIALLSVTACTSKIDRQVGELADARKLWMRSAPAQTYTFELRYECFCPGSTPVSVEVDKMKILAVSSVGDFEAPREDRIDRIPTIYDLFDRILQNIERTTDDGVFLDVEYDDVLGYPRRIDMHYSNLSDGSWVMEVSNVRIR